MAVEFESAEFESAELEEVEVEVAVEIVVGVAFVVTVTEFDEDEAVPFEDWLLDLPK